MIDWVHWQAKAWGRWQSKPINGYPSCSLLGRIREEGSVGAAIKQHAQKIPVKFMPSDIASFHRAWLMLPEGPRQVIAVAYCSPSVDRNQQADLLGLSRRAYYRAIDAAHERLSVLISRQSEPEPSVADVLRARVPAVPRRRYLAR